MDKYYCTLNRFFNDGAFFFQEASITLKVLENAVTANYNYLIQFGLISPTLPLVNKWTDMLVLSTGICVLPKYGSIPLWGLSRRQNNDMTEIKQGFSCILI